MTLPIIWTPAYATRVLARACGSADLTAAIYSIMQGADVNMLTESGDTLVQLVVESDYTGWQRDAAQAEEDRYAIFRLLICSGANIRLRNKGGSNLAHLIFENIFPLDRALSYLNELNQEYTKREHRRGLRDAALRGLVFLSNLISAKDHNDRTALQAAEGLIRKTGEDMFQLNRVLMIGDFADQIRSNGEIQKRNRERREKIRQVIQLKESVKKRLAILRETDTPTIPGRDFPRGL